MEAEWAELSADWDEEKFMEECNSIIEQELPSEFCNLGEEVVE